MSREMRHSGIEWIGEIPKEWKTMPHKYLMSKKKDIQEHYQGQDIISLTMNGVIVRDLDAGGKMPLSFDGYQLVYPNNLLLCLFDIDVTPRCVGLIKNYGVTSPAYSQFVMKKHGHSPYYDYLLRYIDDNKCFLHLSKNLRSSLTETDFGQIYTCVPPLSEQQAIADYLDKVCGEIDDMIALQEKMIEELKAYKQSVITEAVTKGLNPTVPMRDSGIDWIGEISEHWNVSKLKNISMQSTIRGSKGIYIGLENIKSYSGVFIETDSKYNIDEALQCCGGDVLFGKLRPYLAKVHVVEDLSCCSGEFVVLNNSKCPRFLKFLLLSDWFIKIVDSSTYGTKMPRANPYFIMNMKIVVPPLSEQQAIADFLDKKCADIDALIAIKQEKIDSLKEYMKSTIYEYVTGKKQVN